MAFPVSTRATDFLVTAAVWNADLVGNLNSGVMHLIARLSGDLTKTDTTFTDATGMTLPVGASEAWMFGFYPLVSGSAAADVRFTFTYPSGGNFASMVPWVGTTGTVVVNDFGTAGGTGTSAQSFGILQAPSVKYSIPICGVFLNSSTAGNVQMQWAQVAASGTTTMHINSTVWGVKLA